MAQRSPRRPRSGCGLIRLADLDDYIRRAVDAAPPMTVEQLERIAVLLRPTAATV